MISVTDVRASIGRLFAGVLLAVALCMVVPVAGAAQERAEVRGSADFRNPPRLVDGAYSDSIVSGEAVWYEVLYTNGDEYTFDVSLDGVDLEATEELALEASFIGPTLGSVESGTELGGSASYTGGETNAWYLEVVLETTGRRGIEHTLLIDVDGVQESSSDTCTDDPECTLDEDLAALDDELAELDEETSALSDEGGEDVQAEVDARVAEAAELRDQARSVQAEIASLCDPEPDCDTLATTTSTPLWATVVGGVALVTGLGLLGGAALRRRG